jgi:hypothetical protein
VAEGWIPNRAAAGTPPSAFRPEPQKHVRSRAATAATSASTGRPVSDGRATRAVMVGTPAAAARPADRAWPATRVA